MISVKIRVKTFKLTLIAAAASIALLAVAGVHAARAQENYTAGIQENYAASAAQETQRPHHHAGETA